MGVIDYYKVEVSKRGHDEPAHTSVVRSKNKHSAVVNVLVNKYKGDFNRVEVSKSTYEAYIEQRYLESLKGQQQQD